MTEDRRARVDRAMKLHRVGKFADAGTIYADLLREQPADARVLHLAALAHYQSGDARSAVPLIREAVRLSPRTSEFVYVYGVVLQALHQWDEAAASYEAAIVLDPRNAHAHNGWGAVHQFKGRNDDAVRAYRRALAIDPNQPAVHENLGRLLAGEGETERGIEHLRQAIGLAPESKSAHLALGRALRFAGRWSEALAAVERCLSLDPSDAVTVYEKGLVQLGLGDYPAGFATIEARARRTDMRPRPKAPPLWDGGPLAGKRVWLFAEQGQGDLIQFARYIPDVVAAGGRPVVEAHPNLTRLMSAVPGVERVVVMGDAIADADVLLPYMSLPRLFRATRDALPRKAGYLRAPPEVKVELPAARAGERRVGIVWAGNPMRATNTHTSVPLPDLLPLLETPGLRFFSLQKGSAAADLLLSPARDKIVDLDARLSDFAATAAALEQLDLLITTDTAIAHLAGALGRPAFVMLSAAPDWRWQGPDPARSPWYDTLRLFRQTRLNDWQPVIASLQRALANPVL
ncbi:MAG: tetratricopeptide repeat protein [Alphaproteobacteria bacterium]